MYERATDGLPGPDFTWRANVLAGDATSDGAVRALDLSYIKQRLNRSLALPGTGNAAYNLLPAFMEDRKKAYLSAAKLRLNQRLPAGTPAVVVEMAVTRELFGSAPILPE